MKNMDRWLGDGGMAILKELGCNLESYGTSEDGLGWVTGAWEPKDLALNPHGFVQAGVQGVVLDALMNFAVNTSLEGGDRTKATVEMKVELLRPMLKGNIYTLRGEALHVTFQIAFAEANILNQEGKLVSKTTGTFILHRQK